MRNKVKLTPKQERLKKAIKPLVEQILIESDDSMEFHPVVIKGLSKIFNEYGIVDVLFTAKKFYQMQGETSSVKLTDELIQCYKNFYKIK